MPKRKADTVQSLRQAERKREKSKNKRARAAARDVEAIRHNPRAVRDELQRLRHLDNRDELDEKGKLYEHNLHNEGKEYTREIQHLQNTIIELRSRLEND